MEPPMPEKDLFGTAFQASSHFRVLTSIVQIGEQESYSILLGIRLRARPNDIAFILPLFPSEGGILKKRRGLILFEILSILRAG
jgi:hypothetical protein